MSVAITWLLARLHKFVCSSTTRPLPFRIAVQTIVLFLNLSAEWLIPIFLLSLGGSCNHTTSALHWTTVSESAMVHSYDLAQSYRITPDIGSQGYHFRLSLSFVRSRSCNCGLSLGHCDVPCLPCCLLFLHIRHLLLFASSISYRSPGPKTKHHSVCPRCYVHSFTRGSSSC